MTWKSVAERFVPSAEATLSWLQI